MGEAAEASKTETLRPWHWREGARVAWAFFAALPGVVASGWRADAGRRVLFVPALLGLGIGIYFALPQEPPVWAASIAAAIAIVWLGFRQISGASEITAALGALAAIGAGFALAIVRAHTNDVSVLHRETRTLAISGRVVDLEPANRGRSRILLAVYSLESAPRKVLHEIDLLGINLVQNHPDNLDILLFKESKVQRHFINRLSDAPAGNDDDPRLENLGNLRV